LGDLAGAAEVVAGGPLGPREESPGSTGQGAG